MFRSITIQLMLKSRNRNLLEKNLRTRAGRKKGWRLFSLAVPCQPPGFAPATNSRPNKNVSASLSTKKKKLNLRTRVLQLPVRRTCSELWNRRTKNKLELTNYLPFGHSSWAPLQGGQAWTYRHNVRQSANCDYQEWINAKLEVE